MTAVTSQSRTHVRCPICDQSFELADVLEEMIPAVEVVDREANAAKPVAKPIAQPVAKPERINAINTPELFHVPRDNYQPITEKKNGRFVVPELLSKGNRKKKRRRSRRRSRSESRDPRLAKLKENTSATFLPDALSKAARASSLGVEKTDESSGAVDSGKKRRSRKKRHRKSSIEKIPSPSISQVRSVPDFVAFLKACRSLAFHKLSSIRESIEEPSSRSEYVMVGLGVLLALPILQLVMWWFIGIDPLGLARPTGSMVPFVVPNELRSPDASDGMDLDTFEPSRRSPINDAGVDLPSGQTGRDGRLPTPKLDPSTVRADEF